MGLTNWYWHGLRLEFKLSDFWIGAYWRKSDRRLHLWVCIVPCFPLHAVFRVRHHSRQPSAIARENISQVPDPFDR